MIEKDGVVVGKDKEQLETLITEIEEADKDEEWIMAENQGWERMYWDDITGKELDK